MDIKPFNNLPLIKFFQHDLEKIMMAFRLSDTIRRDVSNIRAAGDEVELSVLEFYRSKLFPKYHVGNGHIVDSNLKISPQYDLIISENAKNPVLFNLADKSELLYFEPVFVFAEIKRSFYSNDLIDKFSKNLQRFKTELHRTEIEPTYIETGNTGILVEEPLTSLPLRNPVLNFMFFVDGSSLNMKKIGQYLNGKDCRYLPNFIVILDLGVILNIDRAEYEKGVTRINLYPEYESKDNLWVLLELGDRNNTLIYQYMLVLEHLNSSIVGTPNVRQYTNMLFNISQSSIHQL